MSLSEEKERGGYRADRSAGTDDEYFELLEKRRRQLSRESGGQKSGNAKAAPPRDRAAAGSAPSARRAQSAQPGGQPGGQPGNKPGYKPGYKPDGQSGSRNAGASGRSGQQTKPTSQAHDERRRAEARSAAEQLNRQTAAREAARRVAEEQKRREAAAREAAYRSEEEKRREAAAREAARKAAEEQKRREAAAREAARKVAEERRAAERKRQKDIQKRIRAKKRAELAGRALAVGENLLIFAAFFFMVCAVAFSVFAIYISRTARDEGEDTRGFTYKVEESGTSLDHDEVVSDGVVYVDFSGIAGLCGMSVSGVKDELVFEAGGETAVFVPGSVHASVNGTGISLEGKALLKEDRLWLPLSFVREYVNGVNVSLDEVEKRGRKYRVLTVARTPDPEATGALDCWLEPSFRIKPGSELSCISPYDTPDASAPAPTPAPSYDFISDLSSYEKYMSPEGTVRDSFLLLVNSESRLTYRYVPAGLTDVADARRPGATLTMCHYAAKALEAMLTEARAQGFDTIAVASAYVPYDTQAALFDSCLSAERNYSKNNFAATGKRFSDEAYAVLGSDYLTENYILKENYTMSLTDARRVALSYCAEPGSDEHQSGLCVDLCDTSPSAADFSDSAIYGWLCQNAHKFGFIMRYPADKTEATAHAFEPWHLRYVGRYHAEKIYSSGVCLEEYCEKLNETPSDTQSAT